MLYRFQWNLIELQGQLVFQAIGQTPYLLFYPDQVNSVSGNTGCNNLKGEGGGEITFFNMLKKVNKYSISDGNTLTFMIDDVAVMRFIKK